MSTARPPTWALLATLISPAAHADDAAGFLGLSVSGDGVTPTAADTLAHEPPVKPIELGASASDTGDAHYAVPLELPSTRLPPTLGLSYSSSAGAHSWLGRGWSLSSGMTLSRIAGQVRSQAYAGEAVAPYRLSGGGVSGLLFWRDGAWELHTASPTPAVVTEHPDGTWTVSVQGVTTTLTPAPPLDAPDTWRAHVVQDSWGNQVIYDRVGDRLRSVSWGGTVGAAPGEWAEPPLYTLDVAYQDAPTTSFRAVPGGITAIDQRIVGLTLDTTTACGSPGVSCEGMPVPAWDLCYSPLPGGGGEEVLSAVYLRDGADPESPIGDTCATGESESARLLAALDYTGWDALDPLAAPGPGPFGGSTTAAGDDDLRRTHTRTSSALADINGDGWSDRLAWVPGGAEVRAYLSEAGPGWMPEHEARTVDLPWGAIEQTWLDESVSVITAFTVTDDPVDGYHASRTRLMLQRWVDLDRDGLRDLLVATETPDGMSLITEEPTFLDNLGRTPTEAGPTWTWEVHYGRPWGLEEGAPLTAPFKFPGIARSPSHPRRYVVDGEELERTYDNVDTQLVDMHDLTGDGWVDLVYVEGGSVYVYPFLPSADAWADAPDIIDLPAPFRLDGASLDALEVVRHHTTIRDLDDAADALRTYQQPQIVHSEVIRRFTDLNGDGHVDVVDATPWEETGAWRVVLGHPSGFADEPIDWAAPLGFLTRTYEGEPAVDRCAGPPIVQEYGWPVFEGAELFPEDAGVDDRWLGDDDGGEPEDLHDYGDTSDPDYDPFAHDRVDEGPPFRAEHFSSFYDPGDAPMWHGLEARVSSCGFGSSPDPQRVLVDLIDLDGDGRLDLVDADGGRWHRNLGDGFDTEGDAIPWTDFPSELARSQSFTEVVFAPRNEDPSAIEALNPSHGEHEVLLRVQDVNADGLPDVVTPDAVLLAPFRPPGLLDTIHWSTGAITTLDYGSTAHDAGLADPEPFAAHRAVIRAITLSDPATDQQARTEMSYIRPTQVDGQFHGFHEVIQHQEIADARTRWTTGAGVFQPFSETHTVFALDRDFTLPGRRTYAVDQGLPWLPEDGALATVGVGGATDLQTVSVVVNVHEDADRGKRLDRTEVQSFGDGGAGDIWMTIDAIWDPDTGYLAEVRRYPGLGAWSAGPESTRVLFEDVVTSADGSIRLHATQRTLGWDVELGAEVQQEWVEFVYDDGSESPTFGAAPVTPAVLRQSACGGVPDDDECTNAWETWFFDRGERGELVAMHGPAGASAEMAWALGASVAVSATDALDHTTITDVDGLGRPLRTTDPNGVASETSYDLLGRQASTTVTGVGAEPIVVREWLHHHQAFPEWTEEIRRTADEPGATLHARSAFVVADGLGRPMQEWSPELGPAGWTVSETLTDLSGNPTVIRAPSGESTFVNDLPSLAAPSAFDTLTYTDAQGVARLAWSHHVGNVRTSRPTPTATLTEDGAGRKRLHQSDLLGRLTSVHEGDPLDWTLTATYAWDSRARLTQFTDANGNAYRSLYDQAGRLLEVERRPVAPDADWEPWVAMVYDGPYPTGLFDTDGTLAVTWEHDALGRATSRSVLRDGVMEQTITSWDDDWVGVKSAEITSRGGDLLTSLTFTVDSGTRWGLGHITNQTHAWFDGHTATWSYEHDSDGVALLTTLPLGYTVASDLLPNRWHRADTVHVGPEALEVVYTPGDYGHVHGGWSVNRAFWNQPLSLDLVFASPDRVDRLDIERPDLGVNTLHLGWDAGGRLVSREYTGDGLPAGLLEFTYDDLGRVLEVFRDAESVERIDRDALGVPTSLSRGPNPIDVDPLLPMPVPATWTYAAPHRFGEIAWRSGADDDAAWIEEAMTWDPMGRLARLSHLEPTERAHEQYRYDGLGRLAELDGYERSYDVESGDVDILRWAHTYMYGTDDQLVYEARTGLEPKVVHRFDGYLSDTRTGVTVTALPMVRIVDGDVHFPVQEPSGHAPWVFDGNGDELNHSALGATGVELYQAGAGWHLDGLHASEPDTVVGLAHHGIRHARLDDGLWLQPEPLLYLGMSAGDLAAPQAFGPAYAAGDTNALHDRSGFSSTDTQFQVMLESKTGRAGQWARLSDDRIGQTIAASFVAPFVVASPAVALRAFLRNPVAASEAAVGLAEGLAAEVPIGVTGVIAAGGAAVAGRTADLLGDLARATTRGGATGARQLGRFDWDGAEAAYEAIRGTDDVGTIAGNIGWSRAHVQRVKDHLFNNLHKLDDYEGGYDVARFHADPEIANAWGRLQRGAHTNADLKLLEHELFESKFEGIFRTDYRTAHDAANRAGHSSGLE